ncbi:FxLYD domain-containing protein [Natrononativus amylolyticus]|uniref:FxLYD domain-containing protein n=1 Tax=Natrononativus amylolyticus TaxID=2963434 RepID=UPI0020CFC32B|nr:FxLYD domain-containing protein [Natrononativus amylolyticus]
MQRRRVLSAAGTGLVLGVAGCLDGGPTSGEGDADDETEPDNESEFDDEPGDDVADDADDVANDDGADDAETDDSDDASDDEAENDGNGDDEGTGDGDEPDASDDAASDDESDDAASDDESDDTSDGEEADDGADDAGDDEGADDGETYTLTVTIVDSTSEVPLEGTVDVAGETRETDSDGQATFGLESGSYTVTASSEVYQDSIVDVDLEGDESITMALLPAEAELEITDHELSQETVSGEEAYVVRGTVANTGTVDSEDVVIEVVLYDADGTRLHERYSAPIEMPAETEQEFEFAAIYAYNSAFEDVDPDSYEVAVFSYVGHRRLAQVDGRSSWLSLGGLFS